MHIVTVTIHVKGNLVNEFIQETLKNVHGSLQEREVVSFDFLQSKEDPTRFLLIEVYRNEASVALHQKTMHYLEWKDAVQIMMEQPRSKMTFSNVLLSRQDLNE